MKRLILCMLLLIICMFLKVQGECVIEGKKYPVGEHYVNCIRHMCYKDGRVSGVPCGLFACPPGTQIGYMPTDLTKPYPECCGRPICDLSKKR